jgi:hypothetical protein
MKNEHQIIVEPDGAVRHIYADELLPLADEGTAVTRRASNVEPDVAGGWTADMSPSGSPTILRGFRTRREALEAEVAWLKGHLCR